MFQHLFASRMRPMRYIRGQVRKSTDLTVTHDIARRGSLEEAFEPTRLFDRLVHLGVGNFGRDSIWQLGVNHLMK